MKLSILPILFCLALISYGQQTAVPSPGTKWQYVVMNDKSARNFWPGGIEQQADLAARFLKEVVRPGSDIGSLINFSQEFDLDVENSTNPDELAAKLVRHGYHGTQLYDGIVLAEQWLARQEASNGRKIVFVFSDGDDDASQRNVRDTIAAIQNFNAPIFVISPAVVEHQKPGKEMKQLAGATGGHVYFVDKKGNFDFNVLKRDLGR
jgi:Mg-chelatase subunit ChlD